MWVFPDALSPNMPHVIFDEYFYCAGEHGKKVPNSKTTSEQRYDYIHSSSTYSTVPGPLLLSKVSFGWEAHTFRTIMKLFTFALMMIMLQVINYFNFHYKFFDLVLYLCTFAHKIFFGPRENCTVL